MLISCVAFIPSQASARVAAQSDNGFAILHIGDVAANPEDIWRNLLTPNKWWSAEHSWSGNADNFYLEPKVNGCFCELLTKASADGSIVQNGEVEHMRIIHIEKDRVLRLTGALGPLQSEAVNGTLTIAIQANDNGTSKLSFSYIVGGYMRYQVGAIAPNVDKVIGEQFTNLSKLLGPVIVLPRAAGVESSGSAANDIIEADDASVDNSDGDNKRDGATDEDDRADNPVPEVRRER